MFECVHPCCVNKANYNFKGFNTGMYCYQHKKYNMINYTIKRCNHNKCYNIPFFNYKYSKIPLYCRYHKKDNMVNTIYNLFNNK